MKIINFISGGHLGDLIHELFVVKNICERDNVKANLYILDSSYGISHCHDFRFGLQKTLVDTIDIILSQEYINEYSILPKDFSGDYINLSEWRGIPPKSWGDILMETYKFKSNDYKWLNTDKVDEVTLGKVVIHRSYHRHNANFQWDRVLDTIDGEVVFVTTDISEYERFPYKRDNIIPHLVTNISDLVYAINASKLFIGNQSSPLAIASGLDKPRLCELWDPDNIYYMGEHNHSDNVSWFVNDNLKYEKK
jgi:hypothetical protein